MPDRILIVDDHQIVRKAIRSILSSRSEWMICGEATNGIEGVDQAKALRPDLILMDISMPEMDGIEATRILRRELPQSKIIIVSQNDPEVVQRQVKEVDAAGYVAKTDLFTNLLPTMDQVLRDRKGSKTSDITEADGPGWLAGGGELGQLIRVHDWSKTSLGPIDTWPQSLKTSINLILNSRHPMWVGWGKDIIFLYNDAYIQVLSLAKHPWALGMPCAVVWPEIWDICGPLAEKVFEKGEASFLDDVCFYMNRGDYLEETYYSFSYSPIRGESGDVAGLFCPSTEVTPKVINARRLSTLAELSSNALIQKTTEDACASAVETLAKNAADVPFALLYLIDFDKKQARLEEACAVPRGLDRYSPDVIDLTAADSGSIFWPIAEVAATGRSQIISTKGAEGLPLGAAQQPLSQAVVLPVTSRGEGGIVGVLIAGVNPTRKLDLEYRTFYELIAGQIATAIQNVRSVEEERKRIEALAEIDRAKTAFFSNVSHEFRTPLTLMLGPVEELLAKSHTNLSPAAKSQLELVNRNGSRLLRLVNTLLDFSRLEAGRMQAVYQATDLSTFTVDLASVFRSATERAGLRLELDCAKLGEPVYVDRNMWEKIVLNLISNAFKFTFEGEIAISLREAEGSAELRVRDTGVGISEEELPRLFERFHRIENTRSRTHEGSGIGLALVLELVKLHSGTVRVESALGKGTTFIVSLPLGLAHLPAERIGGSRSSATTALGAVPFVEEALRWLPDREELDADEEIPTVQDLLPVPAPALHGESAGERPYILIADDNSDMRQYLVRLLSERYEVQAFHDGKAALDAALERAPNLVLSDVMMPNLDGFGLLRGLRADSRTTTVPIILLSARAGEEARVEGMEQGADDYLIKPFSARELLARVQTHLQMARLRSQAEDALRRRTEQFETLFNEAPLGVYLVDQDFRLREMNPTAERVFNGVPDAVGRDFGEVIRAIWPTGYADEIVARFRHTLDTGEPYFVPEIVENRIDRGTREIYEWQINRIPLPDDRYGVVCYFREISRQVEAREAIAETGERLRLATEAAELGIWHWYPEDDLVTWENERPYEIFGRAREEGPINATEFKAKYIHPDDAKEFERALLHTVESGARFFYQGRITRNNGNVGWVEFTGQMEYGPDGSPWRVLGTVLDITERKQAEQVIRRSEERLRLSQKASHSGTWESNLQTGEVISSPEVQALFGLPPETTSSEPNQFRTLIDPEDLSRIDKVLSDLIKARENEYHVEFRITRTDGSLRWLESMAHITYADETKKPLRITGVTIDITQRKLVEERERQTAAEAVAATAKFRAVFEQTPVFAGIMSLDGKVMDANQLCLEACGYTADQVLGKFFWDTPWWRHSEETKAKIRAATKLAAEGIPYQETLTYYWSDDTERIVDLGLHPIVDHEGRILFLHPTGVDITEMKRAEEKYRTLAETLDAEVRQRTNELEQRNVEVLKQSQLLRNFSQRLMEIQDEERRRIARELHDSAGQILTALGLNLARVAQKARKDSPALIGDTEDSQQLVQQLSQEIRTMSYLLHPPLLDEVGLSEALRWYTQGLMERSGLEISLTIPEDFGRLPREKELVMFRLVQECLTNIHRHSGSQTASIRVLRDAQSASLEVRDEGKGISPQKLAEMQTRGSGVGIRGMRERVLQFEGDMTIKSDEKGTTIFFTIPLGENPVAKPEKVNEQLQTAG